MIKSFTTIRIRIPILIYFYLVSSIFSSVTAQDIRGFYVNDFKNIIGDIAKENELLQFAQSNNINYLLLYNLYYIHKDQFDITSESTALPLADFIYKAKTLYGIKEVGAVGEKANSFTTIDAYNQLFANEPNRRFDVYHIEFEFWHKGLVEGYYCLTYLEEGNYACTKEGAFEFYLQQLQNLKILTQANGVKAETYIGMPNATQSQQIGALMDRVLVHHYRRSDVYNNGNSIYNFKKYRVEDLSPSTGVLDVLPIFSSRSYFMGPWLETHLPEQAFDTYMNGQNGYAEDNGDWKSHINICGYQWYRYTDMFDYMQSGAGARNEIETPIIPTAVDAASHLEDKISTFKVATQNNKRPALEVFTIYPNPSHQNIYFEFYNTGNTNVSITDVLGNVVSNKIITNSNYGQLDITLLDHGLYFLVFEMGNEKVVRKFIVD